MAGGSQQQTQQQNPVAQAMQGANSTLIGNGGSGNIGMMQALQQAMGQPTNPVQRFGLNMANAAQPPAMRSQLPIQRPVMGAQPFQGAQPPMLGGQAGIGQGQLPGGLQAILRQYGIM